MLYKLTGFGLLGLIAALTVAAVAPASAEFFGCNDRPGKVLATYTSSPSYSRSSSRYTHEFAAQSSSRRYVSSRTVYAGTRHHSNNRWRW